MPTKTLKLLLPALLVLILLGLLSVREAFPRRSEPKIAKVETIAALRAVMPTARAHGQQVEVAGYFTAGDGGGGVFQFNPASAAAENGGTIVAPASGTGSWLRIFSGPVNVRWFGARGIGSDDTRAAQAALSAATEVYFPVGTYGVSSKLATQKYQQIRGSGKSSILKKLVDGYVINLAEWGVMEDIALDGNKGTYTGGGVEIALGANTPVIADQGHQRIKGCYFQSFASYPIDYTAPNMGWMSQVLECSFSTYDSAAAIRWPNDGVGAGNRWAVNCYSAKALVNVGACQNGYIQNNVTGGTVAPHQGVVFPTDLAGGPQKLIITGNRFAIGDGTMNIYGDHIIFAENIIAGSVEVAAGTTNLEYRATDRIGTFTDRSGKPNQIFLESPIPFTPTWTTYGDAPAFGNADVRCEYIRRGAYIDAKYYIKFGSTTAFGALGWKFTIPVPRLTELNTDFSGSAFVGANSVNPGSSHPVPGTVKTLFQIDQDTIQAYTHLGILSADSPATWGKNDELIMNITYRIF